MSILSIRVNYRVDDHWLSRTSSSKIIQKWFFKKYTNNYKIECKKKKNPKENYQVSKRMKTSLVVEIKKIFGAFAMDLEGWRFS